MSGPHWADSATAGCGPPRARRRRSESGRLSRLRSSPTADCAAAGDPHECRNGGDEQGAEDDVERDRAIPAARIRLGTPRTVWRNVTSPSTGPTPRTRRPSPRAGSGADDGEDRPQRPRTSPWCRWSSFWRASAVAEVGHSCSSRRGASSIPMPRGRGRDERRACSVGGRPAGARTVRASTAEQDARFRRRRDRTRSPRRRSSSSDRSETVRRTDGCHADPAPRLVAARVPGPRGDRRQPDAANDPDPGRLPGSKAAPAFMSTNSAVAATAPQRMIFVSIPPAFVDTDSIRFRRPRNRSEPRVDGHAAIQPVPRTSGTGSPQHGTQPIATGRFVASGSICMRRGTLRAAAVRHFARARPS